MPDKFDPYREALVMEEDTIWSGEYDDWEPEEKERLEKSLHADPENAAHLVYFRVHTGFCRQITVTDNDIERVQR